MRGQRETHHRRSRWTRRSELGGLAYRRGNRVAPGHDKAEAWEVALGRRREQVQRVNAARLSLGDDALDEQPTETAIAIFGIDGCGAEETVLTTNLQAHDADDSLIALGYHECAQRVGNSGYWQVARDEELLDGVQVLDHGLPYDDSGHGRGAHDTTGLVARTNALMN